HEVHEVVGGRFARCAGEVGGRAGETTAVSGVEYVGGEGAQSDGRGAEQGHGLEGVGQEPAGVAGQAASATECGQHSRGVVRLAGGDEVGYRVEEVAIAGAQEVAGLEVIGDVPGLAGVGGVQQGTQ